MKITGLYKRGDVYWYRRQVGGRRKYVSLGTSDFATAVAKAVEIRDEIHDEVRNDQLSLARKEFLIEHEKEVRGKTTVFYRYSLSKLDPLAAKPIRSITNAKLAELIADLDLADDSINTVMRGWRTFFNWCVKTKRLRQSPFMGLKFRSTGSRIRDEKACTKEQRDWLITHAPNDDMKFILYAGFHAGLRKLEIIEARRDWFDLERKFIHVKKATKGNRRLREGEKPYLIKDSEEKTVPLSDKFLDFLYGYLSGREPLDFVLRPEVKHGGSEYRFDFRKAFERYARYGHGKRGMGFVTPHTMRHTFASLQAQSGKSLDIIAAWMGDSPEVVRKHYAHYAKHDEDINL